MTSDEIKAGMRRLLAEKGQKVQFIERWAGYITVDTFGWEDSEAYDHIKGRYYDRVEFVQDVPCGWVVPEGTVVKEESYDMFDGTDQPGRMEVGLNAAGCRCECGKYTDVTLRLTTTLGEAIQALLGYGSRTEMRL